MRCWWCGVEPDGVYEVSTMDHDRPVATFVAWPSGGDHTHSEVPPTPDELIESGNDALLVIQDLWTR